MGKKQQEHSPHAPHAVRVFLQVPDTPPTLTPEPDGDDTDARPD